MKVALQSKNKTNNTYKKNLKSSVKSNGIICAGILASIPISFVTANAIAKQSKGLSNKEIETLKCAINKVYGELTNLSEKGVKIDNIGEFYSYFKPKKIPSFIYELIDPLYTASIGKNSFFSPSANTIIANVDKLPASIFHELGHAYNKNNSKFWSFIQKIKLKTKKLPVLLALSACFLKKQEPENNNNLTKIQKIKNTIRKSLPMLAFFAFLPSLSEELPASIRGCIWAKNLLDKNLYKKVLKTNIIGYSSYILTILALCKAILYSLKIKDKQTPVTERN